MITLGPLARAIGAAGIVVATAGMVAPVFAGPTELALLRSLLSLVRQSLCVACFREIALLLLEIQDIIELSPLDGSEHVD